MAIFVDENTKVIVQGLTGGQGKFHGLRNRDYGTQVVGGVTPGKGGQDVEGIPVFDTRRRRRRRHRRHARRSSPCRRRPRRRRSSRRPRPASGSSCASPRASRPRTRRKVFNTLVRDFPSTRLLGPNCPGIISPGKCNIGITAGEIAQLPSADGPNVGIVSRSGTLTYQALYELQQNGIGVSTCVGIGGDPVPGTSFVDCLAEFQDDPETHAIIMFGEIGGSAEEEAAEFITANVTKPMSAYIAGVTAPAGKKMGHAGAIVSGGKGTAQGKMDALAAAGVKVGLQPDRGRRADGRTRQGSDHGRSAARTDRRRLAARRRPASATGRWRRWRRRTAAGGGGGGGWPASGGAGVAAVRSSSHESMSIGP